MSSVRDTVGGRLWERGVMSSRLNPKRDGEGEMWAGDEQWEESGWGRDTESHNAQFTPCWFHWFVVVYHTAFIEWNLFLDYFKSLEKFRLNFLHVISNQHGAELYQFSYCAQHLTYYSCFSHLPQHESAWSANGDDERLDVMRLELRLHHFPSSGKFCCHRSRFEFNWSQHRTPLLCCTKTTFLVWWTLCDWFSCNPFDRHMSTMKNNLLGRINNPQSKVEMWI